MTTYAGWRITALVPVLFVANLSAQQIDIAGPSGSGAFGASVTVLPNGNIVVTDPHYSIDAGHTSVGAVYLFAPNGGSPVGTPISTLTGGTSNDQIGSEGIYVLANGNFVVVSTNWNSGAGAVTWGDANAGVSGAVSAGNSLVGSTANDYVGDDGVTALTNGNYVVNSYGWGGGMGASTWGSGTAGVTGSISSSNSLVGTVAGDHVGLGSKPLSNGNYVVVSSQWNGKLGAATWGDGTTGVTGTISSSNSLIGSTAGDYISGSGIAALSNGNYVVCSPWWQNGAVYRAGAATWGNGTTGINGPVSASNSLVGSNTNDQVGYFATPLSNGNYVVHNFDWYNPTTSASQAGAATWGDGNSGVVGTVSDTNSLVGTSASDQVGSVVTPLGNGNYVVGSIFWNNAGATMAGAATWGSGTDGGPIGAVSAANSLVGSTTNDQVGSTVALANGNYVVASSQWNNGATAQVGAVTWGDGAIGTTGPVSPANSLIGSAASDQVGYSGVTALSNGNYVVGSWRWPNAATNLVGAATWGDGASGTTGVVGTSNSLVGTTFADQVGLIIVALNNGDYVVGSPFWNDPSTQVGAVTWGNGNAGGPGVVGSSNSLLGSSTYDRLGFDGLAAVGSNSYVIVTFNWTKDADAATGAVTLARGYAPFAATVNARNSVIGSGVSSGYGMNWGYDTVRDQLAVGRPVDNIVSLFKADALFASDFEVH
jgi:hypothetical protein